MYGATKDGPIEHGQLIVEVFTSGPFAENCFLVYAGDEALVIDPGHSAETISARVAELGLRPVAIANTHAHIDHVAAAGETATRLWSDSKAASFWLHEAELPVLESVPLQARVFGLQTCETPEVTRRLAHDDTLAFGGLELRVLHTPGHTPGGCCFYQPEARVVFVGDTLFAGSIGRSDLPGGDHDTLIASIKRWLLTLPDEVTAYPGHGPQTTLGDERRQNPFLR